MKKSTLLVAVLLVTLLTTGFTAPAKKTGNLEYIKICSQFMNVTYEKGYTVYEDFIFVKSSADKSFHFQMAADLSGEKQYLAKGTSSAFATTKTGTAKLKLSINAHEEKLYHVWFKAKTGKTKGIVNKLPPASIRFTILK